MHRINVLAALVVLSCVVANAQAAPAPAPTPARNYRTMALTELKTFAEANVPEAQIELASRYETGRGVKKDSIEANTWYRKAADAGSNEAALTLAKRLIEGTAADQNEALRLYRRLAEAGNTRAMCEVGECYKEGHGTFADQKQAIEWFTKAADSGDPEGQYRLGECSRDGIGMAADSAKAADLFKKAADKGHAGAAYALGQMYRSGEGMQKNPKEAINLFSKAAAKNHVDAQWALAQMYRTGEGVPADKEKAVALLRKLVAARHPDALATLAQLNPEALKQLSKPLTFVGNLPDEKLIGALVRGEGQMKAGADGQWFLVARALGGRPMELAVTPPPSANAPAAAGNNARAGRAPATRPVSNRGNPRPQTGLQVKNPSAAAGNPAEADVTNWARVKDGMPVTLWGTVNEKKEFQALMVKLTPPSVKWDYRLRDTAGVAAGQTQKFTIEGSVTNTGKTPLKALKMKLRIYQESSPNDASKEYTIESIAPGTKVEFTVDATLYNYSYAGGTSKPKVEMEVLGYDW